MNKPVKILEENKFTADRVLGSVSPSTSIGEPLSSSAEVGIVDIPEFLQSKFPSPSPPPPPPPPLPLQVREQSQWGIEKQQLTVQLTLLQEQLQAETAARIESQVSTKGKLTECINSLPTLSSSSSSSSRRLVWSTSSSRTRSCWHTSRN